MGEGIRVHERKLIEWVARVFEKGNVPRDHALICAEVLALADMRGIESHGVARLPFYWRKIDNGTINVGPKPKVVHEMASVALFDGDNGLGPVVGREAMELAMDKAQETGAGFVSVNNSNHYGIAGYYTLMALERDMIGISMTNALALVAPTFGSKPILGTNPISVSAPTNKEIPPGWVRDKQGKPSVKPVDMIVEGSLTPLGGDYEHGDYKGYGLALMVDLFTAILSGANYGVLQEGLIKMATNPEPSNVGHFFGALKVEGFRPLDEFKKTMDDALRALKDSPKAEGHDRIYVAGEPEYDAWRDSNQNGVPLSAAVVASLTNLGDQVGVMFDYK